MEEIVVISDNGSIFVKKLTEMEEKLPEIDESKLGKNPFSQELVIDVTKVEDEGKFIVDEDGVSLPAHHYIEKQKCVKFYKFKGAREHMLSLSAGALRMIVYIGFTLDGSKDYIRVLPSTYDKKTGKGSLNTYKRAIDELITAGYLTPTIQIYKHTYWVNPAMMFCASRKDKYPTKVRVKGSMNNHEGFREQESIEKQSFTFNKEK